jgi:hypothetical protein
MLARPAFFRHDMAHPARRSIDYRDRSFTGATEAPSFFENWLLAATFIVAEWAVAYLGPFFWIILAAGYLAATFG